MINFYIDDSGTNNLNDSAQPITLFSAVCINNSNLHMTEGSIQALLTSIQSDLNGVLTEMLTVKKYEDSLQETKVRTMLLNKLIGTKFEFHCAELNRGDDAYMLFDKAKRYEYIEDMLKIVNNNNIDIITVYIDKDEYKKQHKQMNAPDIQKKSERDLIDTLIKELNKYLENKNEQGCIIIDKGNAVVKKLLIPTMKTETYQNLSSEVLEKDSYDSLTIQLADTCAYTSNMKLVSDYKTRAKIRNKKEEISNKLFDIFKNNCNLINVSDKLQEVEKAS